jgi:hypothetical protein
MGEQAANLRNKARKVECANLVISRPSSTKYALYMGGAVEGGSGSELGVGGFGSGGSGTGPGGGCPGKGDGDGRGVLEALLVAMD